MNLLNIYAKNNDPWLTEPSFKTWNYRGIRCVIRRMGVLGHLCGYALIPPGHPFAGMEWRHVPVSVHGGVTYAEYEESYYWDPSHVEGFYIGFDCNQSSDYSPSSGDRSAQKNRYKDINYATRETERMVDQIVDYTGGEE